MNTVNLIKYAHYWIKIYGILTVAQWNGDNWFVCGIGDAVQTRELDDFTPIIIIEPNI